MIEFFVNVNAQPWKAPDPIPMRTKGGKQFIKLVTPGVVRDYQEELRDKFTSLYPDCIPTPKGQPVGVEFHFWRRQGYRGKPADVTNLQKSTEDGLQGLLYENDRDVVHVASTLHDQSKTADPMLYIKFFPFISIDVTPPDVPPEFFMSEDMLDPAGDDFTRPENLF